MKDVRVFSKQITKEKCDYIASVTEFQIDEDCACCSETFDIRGESESIVIKEFIEKMRYVETEEWEGFACCQCIKEGRLYE